MNKTFFKPKSLPKQTLQFQLEMVKMTEAMAAFEAVNMAIGKIHRGAHVQGDVLIIICNFKKEISRQRTIQLILDDTIELSNSLSSCNFNSFFREINQVAHGLTRWTIVSLFNEVWLECSPAWLEDVLVANLPLSIL